ncbi:hypothetical protein RI129_010345 [Pyrocoelia pectoralis]|uniref:Uncharacterized protein n=1 Tax=Pyrocoelia pectoralis TaxID=417401 RepID=A0AAN7ZJV8_9COLE
MYRSSRVLCTISKFSASPRYTFGTKIGNFFNRAAPSLTKPDAKADTLKDECVVITNGEGGLGADLAIQLAKLKAKVIIWDKNAEVLLHTKKYIKSTAGYDLEIHSCDLSNREDIYKAAETTQKQYGQVSMVINTVYLSSERPFLNTNDNLLDNVFRTNIMSHIWITKAFLPHMVCANKGRFVAISSMAAHTGLPKLTDLCTTNSAISSFMSALRTELEHTGVTGVKMTCICPYFLKNSNLHKNAKLRLIHGVGKEELMERTLKAILNDESEVFMPGWFKFPIALKWYCPNAISTFLKKVLIKDSNSLPIILDEDEEPNNVRNEEMFDEIRPPPFVEKITAPIAPPKSSINETAQQRLKQI